MNLSRHHKPIQAAGKKLRERLEALADTPTLFLSSGGSALSLLSYGEVKSVGPQLTVGVVDERYTTDPAGNNFQKLIATDWYTSVHAAGAAEIDTTPRAGDSCQELNLAFAAALQAWRTQYPHGYVLVTMGMGVDGHTAGIFSEVEPVVFRSSAWTHAYSLPPQSTTYTERVTTTYTFLEEVVDESIWIITGAEKQAMARQVVESGVFTPTLPATILHSMQNVHVFTDKT